MKHIINYLGALLAVVLIGATFTACAEDDEGSANVGLGIKTFFPTKVVTNQPMTINGSGFSDVTEIEFPGGIKVSNFEIVGNDMIRVDAPAGIPADGGKIVVRTADDEAESRLPLTLGHTVVSGFSKQPGEEASGGELIEVYGTDLEFIKSVELLDAEGEPQIIDHKDFARKGTSKLVFRVPPKNIFEGTFIGSLYTYDGQKIALPELAYKPAAGEGHWETVKTIIWENDGSHGNINWSSDYRFAPESNSTGEEIATIPQDLWERMKTETFYILAQPNADWYNVRVTTGWWDPNWNVGDIGAGNERIIMNDDGTFYIELNFTEDADFEGALDARHLLFTGEGYTPLQIYFQSEEWIGGDGHMEVVKTSIWKNDGRHGNISWSSDYRFAPESNSTGEEIATIPQDLWERMKTETFYILAQPNADWYNVRVTTGWWDPNWNVGDIGAGNERIIMNDDGTFYIELNFTGDADFVGALDARHLLFTGEGYTPLELYFQTEEWVGGETQEIDIWKNDGSHGNISWSSDYRFAPESNSTGEEIYTVPQDLWDKMKNGTFYLQAQPNADWYNVRVTTGWWDPNWNVGDIGAGNERIIMNDDGTFCIELNFTEDADFEGALDARHLLFTGEGYTPLRLYLK